jgi:hypothetical protein
MAVEATETSDRQVVTVTWDKEVVTGEVVQLYCVNPENGDVSQSGLSANDGEGFVTYPAGYSGSSEVTVYDNDGNADFGVITVGEAAPPEVNVPVFPTHPIVLPPDSPLEPTHPIVLPPEGEIPPEEGGGEPTHPIVLPPLGIWPTPPEGSELPTHPIALPDPHPEHPIAPGGEPPSIWPNPGLPTHPIVIPPDLGYNPPPGASVPTPQK